MKKAMSLVLIVLALVGCTAPDKPSVSLYLAVQRGDLEQVERHLHWGTDLNTAFPNGSYALHEAVRLGRFVISKAILDASSDINLRNQQGDTAIELAVLNGRIQIAELMIKRGAQINPDRTLLRLAQQDVYDRDSVKFLIEQGAKLDTQDAVGDTSLIIAIRHNNHRLAHHLVNQGASVNQTSKTGLSPLAVAKQQKNPELVTFLVKNGASE
ncbi:MAG: ankyrin repeat domain-containing protein [Sedimenticolaceae bacterium]